MAEKFNKSAAIRECLAKHGPTTTYKQVAAEMEALGINAGMFSVIKNKCKSVETTDAPAPKRGRKPKAVAEPVLAVEVNLDDAIAFVQKAGGLAKAAQQVAAAEAEVALHRSWINKVQEIAALVA